MSTATISATCCCGSIGRTDLRQCAEHFHIWNGDKRLASVGRIIRDCWPAPERMPPADVLENARHRGEQTDDLFSAYVLGRLTCIPAGTRKDVYDPNGDGLLQKLMRWFDKQRFTSVQAQVLLGGTDHGGVMDLRLDGMAVDLKSVYDIDAKHIMQVAGYHQIDPLATASKGAAILHVTERYKEPRLIPLESRDYDDWLVMLAHWRMLQRRAK